MNRKNCEEKKKKKKVGNCEMCFIYVGGERRRSIVIEVDKGLEEDCLAPHCCSLSKH